MPPSAYKYQPTLNLLPISNHLSVQINFLFKSIFPSNHFFQKMSSSRSSSYTHAEDTHLCHIYLDVSQNPIIGIYQSMEMFWARIDDEYNKTRPAFMTEYRTGRSLQCRMGTILPAVGKLRSCLRQIESLNPSGASEVDMVSIC